MPIDNAFSSSYVGVEQWNPGRYYNETGQTPKSLPTGTTGPASTAPAPSPLLSYLPIVVVVLIVWALERHKVRIFGRAAAGASA
jgi:hypothetical protein